MRIAVCGSANLGKSTLIQDFLQEWSMYGFEKETYRDIIVNKELKHSKETNKETQKAILDYMVNTLDQFDSDDKVIFDRCPLDNLVYSLWACDKGISDIDEDFISECIPTVREALTKLDIIFFIPRTKLNPKIEDDGMREVDEEYIKEIDTLFKMLQLQYQQHPQDNPFFPRDDSPALIEVFGTRPERMQMIRLYLDADGDLMGGEGGTSDIFNPENLDMMEQILKEQNLAKEEEEEVKKQLEAIKEFQKENKS
tara:strand:- start:477 stop:1238 length:762 start_codon:yes stop_codon:yes gene_type:complete